MLSLERKNGRDRGTEGGKRQNQRREGFDEKAALAERLEEVKRQVSWWNSIPDGGRSRRDTLSPHRTSELAVRPLLWVAGKGFGGLSSEADKPGGHDNIWGLWPGQ